MAVQALTMPVDIPWQRLAFSPDLMDTDYESESLPPKWRSSLCVFGYAVPQEQTAEAYPDARVIYLRMSCSITGLNLNEELREAVTLDHEDADVNDFQEGAWEALRAAGWARRYLPCLSAIAQFAVYPPRANAQVSVAEYPYILDFEPKKREVYETGTESTEALSGSSDYASVLKGGTGVLSTEATEYRKFKGDNWSSELPTNVTRAEAQVSVVASADLSRERRETLSHSTTINQLYQLLNGYHVGLNRVFFTLQARPHTVTGGDGQPIAFNLVNGERKLEGIQDMFLVVYLPAQFDGFCMQANLDTGHYIAADDDSILYVTRRVVRTCVSVNEGGRLVAGTTAVRVEDQFAANEIPLGFKPPDMGGLEGLRDRFERAHYADRLNEFQRHVAGAMLDGFTTADYKPRPFGQTDVFRKLVERTLGGVKVDLKALLGAGYLDAKQMESYSRAGARTVGDLFSPRLRSSPDVDQKQLLDLRSKLAGALLKGRPR